MVGSTKAPTTCTPLGYSGLHWATLGTRIMPSGQEDPSLPAHSPLVPPSLFSSSSTSSSGFYHLLIPRDDA
ncbi:hypothetical protein HYQ44_016363 [Verticillium longisporum]|nr:hypothetical protein HYQ44_016363 [Verticillium longisporum]